MPVLEAMLQGCPVICGRHSSLAEISGDAAHFTDVNSPSALAEALIAISQDQNRRASLREAGHRNAQRFDRRELAEKTRRVYEMVHREHFS